MRVFPKNSTLNSALRILGSLQCIFRLAMLAPLVSGLGMAAQNLIATGDGDQAPFIADISLAPAAAVPEEPIPAVAPEFRLSIHETAALELKQQEQQRVLRTVPEFNITDIKDAARLSPGQKFQLAFRGIIDPSSFVVAGLDAVLSQHENDFPAYGQGAQGFGKRFGASFADSADGTFLGNALFPILLHQDPRYFRKNTGSFRARLFYALASIAICKGDNGKWQPNYSNLLGNVAAGGISNLYYPPADRGAMLTFERAATVTAEGVASNVFFEFWPDISRKIRRKHV